MQNAFCSLDKDTVSWIQEENSRYFSCIQVMCMNHETKGPIIICISKTKIYFNIIIKLFKGTYCLNVTMVNIQKSMCACKTNSRKKDQCFTLPMILPIE